ncbi:MAG TPA: hypothetical protein VIC59_03350 [Gemmatimonadota bacterium]
MKADLNEKMISAGAQLLKQLGRAGFPVGAAVWLYDGDADRWRLVVAPHSRAQGFSVPGARLEEAIRSTPGGARIFTPGNVRALQDRSALARLLRRIVKTESDGGEASRAPEGAIDGRYLEDAFIYRLPRNE